MLENTINRIHEKTVLQFFIMLILLQIISAFFPVSIIPIYDEIGIF
jgi:hypothetical protein